MNFFQPLVLKVILLSASALHAQEGLGTYSDGSKFSNCTTILGSLEQDTPMFIVMQMFQATGPNLDIPDPTIEDFRAVNSDDPSLANATMSTVLPEGTEFASLLVVRDCYIGQ